MTEFSSGSVIFRILNNSTFLQSFFYWYTLSGLQNFMTTRRDKSFGDYVFLLGLMFSFPGFGHPKLSEKYFHPENRKPQNRLKISRVIDKTPETVTHLPFRAVRCKHLFATFVLCKVFFCALIVRCPAQRENLCVLWRCAL